MKYLLYPGCDSPFPPSCSLPCLENFLAHFCQSHPSYNTELRTHLFHEASPEDKKDSPALTRDNRHARLHFELQSWIQPLFLASGSCSSLPVPAFSQEHSHILAWCLFYIVPLKGLPGLMLNSGFVKKVEKFNFVSLGKCDFLFPKRKALRASVDFSWYQVFLHYCE